MSIRRISKRLTAFLVVILCIIVTVSFIVIYKSTSGAGTEATVVRVVNRPNIAEDGYYGITIRDDSGRQYTIDATGYLNTAATPEMTGVFCLDIPEVKTGDHIVFRLPRSEGSDASFTTCNEGSLNGYYFAVR